MLEPTQTTALIKNQDAAARKPKISKERQLCLNTLLTATYWRVVSAFRDSAWLVRVLSLLWWIYSQAGSP
jgi:hypothetical protein